MTFFSRLLINPQRREARKLLASAQAMHAAVQACFPPDTQMDGGRLLWRLDIQHPTYTLYILSPAEPDLRHLQEAIGWESRPGETAAYANLLNKLEDSQNWAFRLTANPVKSLPAGNGKRGKIVPHVTVEQQQGWLAYKAPQWGFEVLPHEDSEELNLLVTHRQDLNFSRKDSARNNQRGRVTLRQAQFEGVLKITDAELFKQALVNGMGRGKAYGCGLMTLRSIQQ